MKPRDRKSVVVPAVAPSSAACIRSLGSRGIRTIAVSETETAPEFHSKYCDETLVVPDPGTDFLGYKDALLGLAKRPSVQTITPLREEDVWALAKYRSEFATHITPLWPTVETLRTVYDRVELMKTASEAGVAVPETWTFDEVEDWSHEQIAKPRYAILTDEYVDSVSSTEVVHPGSVSFLQPGHRPNREEMVTEMGHVPIVQEYVPGSEYALWALYDRGDVVATCQKHQIRGYSYAGNTSVARQTTSIPDLETVGRTLLDALDWHGPVSVQFVRNEATGEFTLLEINPRFWVSLECPIRAGVDFAYYYWCLACDLPVRAQSDYESGIATHLLRGELVHILSILREDNPVVEPPSLPGAVWDVASSIRRQPHFDYLSVTDPGPFARDVLNTCHELFGAALDESNSPRERPTDSPDVSTVASEMPTDASTGVLYDRDRP
ncbi:ATP-grasp domain-containing protein [Natrinema gelatinilyticum]|uniref:carboxylate--amine ligase n=1 Tax=Natrinema gelatinilyticum TaxID=2961571 RepID=UPI0020C3007C|nr:ATP-grasp domain-containing protein [Natrinema gelatinilyticum]